MALFPGGFGTLDEAMETLTLVQTGKRNPMPLVLVDDPDRPYWPHLIKFLEDELLARNFICAHRTSRSLSGSVPWMLQWRRFSISIGSITVCGMFTADS